jgi:hypothetical protein
MSWVLSGLGQGLSASKCFPLFPPSGHFDRDAADVHSKSNVMRALLTGNWLVALAARFHLPRLTDIRWTG